MKRILIILVALGLFAVGGATSVALADKPPAPPGKDPCSHGNTGKPCRPDPQPDRGKDCEKHGKEGGVNEDHCAGATTTTTTTTTTTQPPTTTTTTQPARPSPSPTAPPTGTTPTPTAPAATSPTKPTAGAAAQPGKSQGASKPSKPGSSPNPPPPGATAPSAGTLPFTS